MRDVLKVTVKKVLGGSGQRDKEKKVKKDP